MDDSQEKDCSFLFPNLYDALVYERKLKSEYLERQINERSLKSGVLRDGNPVAGL